jgi:hypothetical protein
MSRRCRWPASETLNNSGPSRNAAVTSALWPKAEAADLFNDFVDAGEALAESQCRAALPVLRLIARSNFLGCWMSIFQNTVNY